MISINKTPLKAAYRSRLGALANKPCVDCDFYCGNKYPYLCKVTLQDFGHELDDTDCDADAFRFAFAKVNRTHYIVADLFEKHQNIETSQPWITVAPGPVFTAEDFNRGPDAYLSTVLPINSLGSPTVLHLFRKGNLGYSDYTISRPDVDPRYSSNETSFWIHNYPFGYVKYKSTLPLCINPVTLNLEFNDAECLTELPSTIIIDPIRTTVCNHRTCSTCDRNVFMMLTFPNSGAIICPFNNFPSSQNAALVLFPYADCIWEGFWYSVLNNAAAGLTPLPQEIAVRLEYLGEDRWRAQTFYDIGTYLIGSGTNLLATYEGELDMDSINSITALKVLPLVSDIFHPTCGVVPSTFQWH